MAIYETALRALNVYRGDPVAIIDEALAADPDFVMDQVLRASGLLTMWERSVGPKIEASVARLKDLHDRSNDRERRHAHASDVGRRAIGTVCVRSSTGCSWSTRAICSPCR